MAEQPPRPGEGEPSETERLVREVIHRFLVALHRGEQPVIAHWVSQNPACGPDLAARLERAAAVYRAAMEHSSGTEPDWVHLETQAMSADQLPGGKSGEHSDPGEAPTEVATPLEHIAGEEALRIRCPHCGHRIQVALSGESEIVCRSCGSSFHVDSAIGGLVREQKQPAFIGRFTVVERLGRGGFGVVYKASDPLLARHVAVKMPRSGYFASAEDEERFLREARNAARLRHPHIVRIHEIDRHHGVPYIVSEFIEGQTLADLLTRQRLDFGESARLLIAVAEALEYAHQQHVVHRDVKPSNILIDAEGHPYVTDFGLARRDDAEITITLDGQVLGTPAYMSPEQAAGEPARVDRRSDVYSLGVVLYHALCGELPFHGTRRMLVQQVLQDEPRPLRRINEHVPRDLETITLKAMSKEPQRRYATARELADELRRWLNGEPIHARPLGRTGRLVRWGRRNPVTAGLCAAIAALLITSAVVAASWAWRERVLRLVVTQERNRAELSERQSRERLVLRHLQDGVQHLQSGDVLTALLWGAEAAQQDATDQPLSTHHALRLGLLLDRCPALLQLWDRPDQVCCAAGTGVGDRVLVAAQDGSLVVYDIDTGAAVTPVMQHGTAVMAAVIDAHGDRVVSLGMDHAAQLWNARTGERIAQLPHDARPLQAVFSRDGRLVATGGLDGTARIWLAETGGPVATVVLAESQVNLLRFSPDTTRLLTGSMHLESLRGELRLWDASTGEPRGGPLHHDAYVWDAAFSADGQRIVSGSEDGTVCIWDAVAGVASGEPLVRDAPVHRVFWAEQDTRIIAVVSDGQVRVWNAQTRQLLPVAIHHGGTLTDAALSPAQTLLATCSVDGRTRIWSWATGVEMSPSLPHTALVSSVAFAASERRVVTASQDGTVKVWDLAAAVAAEKPLVHAGPVRAARFSPDGTQVLTCSEDHSARLWSAATGAPLGAPLDHGAIVLCAEFHPAGALVATGGADNAAQLWDARTGQAVGGRLVHAGVVSSLRFSPDGKQLVTASRDGSAKVWDVASQELRHVLNHPAGVLSLAYSPDGRWIATGSEDGTLQIWVADTGEAHGGVLRHDDAVYHCLFSPDSAYLLSGSRDRTARIWRVEDSQPVRPPLRHTASVNAVHWCVDQPWFLTGDLQGNLRHWTWEAADLPAASFSLPELQVNAVRYLAGGTLFAATFNRQAPRARWSGSGAGVWELATGKLLAPLWPLWDEVYSLDVSPDGTLLLTAGADGVARLWPLRPTERSVDELVRVGQLLSGRRIDRGVNLVALDAATLRREFLDLRDRQAGGLSVSQEDAANWDRWLAVMTPDRPQRTP